MGLGWPPLPPCIRGKGHSPPSGGRVGLGCEPGLLPPSDKGAGVDWGRVCSVGWLCTGPCLPGFRGPLDAPGPRRCRWPRSAPIAEPKQSSGCIPLRPRRCGRYSVCPGSPLLPTSPQRIVFPTNTRGCAGKPGGESGKPSWAGHPSFEARVVAIVPLARKETGIERGSQSAREEGSLSGRHVCPEGVATARTRRGPCGRRLDPSRVRSSTPRFPSPGPNLPEIGSARVLGPGRPVWRSGGRGGAD